MNICFFCDSIFSIGGVQKVLALIASDLSRENKVTILTMDRHPHYDANINNLQNTQIQFKFFQFVELSHKDYYFHAPYSGAYKKFLPHNRFTSYLYSLSSFPQKRRKQLIETLNEGNYDVIIGVHAFLSLKLATIRKHLNARKVIGWMHNSYQAFFENNPAYLENLKSHFKFQMRKLDGIVVLTKTDAELYKKNLGLNPTVIYNPVTIKAQRRCDTNAKTFLSVGRMSYRHKGFDILIKAFALFCKENKEWKLNIVGEGPEKENLEELIQSFHLENRISIYPFTNEIEKYYSTASVYVLSSRWEGFPLVLMEALSFGLPIISSDIPISKEVLEKKDFCFFFKNEDAESLCNEMKRMACADLAELSDGAHSFSQQSCHIDEIIKQWNAIFDEA